MAQTNPEIQALKKQIAIVQKQNRDLARQLDRIERQEMLIPTDTANWLTILIVVLIINLIFKL